MIKNNNSHDFFPNICNFLFNDWIDYELMSSKVKNEKLLRGMYWHTHRDTTACGLCCVERADFAKHTQRHRLVPLHIENG